MKLEYEKIGMKEVKNRIVIIKGYFEEDEKSIHLKDFKIVIIEPTVDSPLMEEFRQYISDTMWLDDWKWENGLKSNL